MIWGGELVLRDGVAVGQVTSGAWGETLGALRRPGLRPPSGRRGPLPPTWSRAAGVPGERRRPALPGRREPAPAVRPGQRPDQGPLWAVRLDALIAVAWSAVPGEPRPFRGRRRATHPHSAPPVGRRHSRLSHGRRRHGRRRRGHGPHRLLGPGAAAAGGDQGVGHGAGAGPAPPPTTSPWATRCPRASSPTRPASAWMTRDGYPDQVYAALRPSHPGLEAGQAGLPGRDHQSRMINGGICRYRGGSQLAAAVAFLQRPPRPGAPGHPRHRRQRPRSTAAASPASASSPRARSRTSRPPSPTWARSWPG